MLRDRQTNRDENVTFADGVVNCSVQIKKENYLGEVRAMNVPGQIH